MFSTPEIAPQQPVISVSELNRLARSAIERSLPLTWVAGEMSNLRRYDSGHWYFTLKDAAAQVDCVMFRHKAQHLDWQPADGMQVEVRALATVYEARGKYQLNIEAMRRAGLGALYEAFEKRKAKLAKEGLFDEARKREIPAFPRGVAVVTSPQAAALRNVLTTTLKRRMPSIPVTIYPAPVQGEGAAARIVQAIAAASARADADGCDVLILCRGGGSIEDLWSFNEEIVARAVHACTLPVVTGVGHETDFTIVDFVADARAPTPTAAAELVSPDRVELAGQVGQLGGALMRGTRRVLEDRMQKLDYLSRRLAHPGERLRERTRHLTQLAGRLKAAVRHVDERRAWALGAAARALRNARPDVAARERELQQAARAMRETMRRFIEQAQSRVTRADAHVSALNPQRMLERGYSIAETVDGVIVRDARLLNTGDVLKISFARGQVESEVKRKV